MAHAILIISISHEEVVLSARAHLSLLSGELLFPAYEFVSPCWGKSGKFSLGMKWSSCPYPVSHAVHFLPSLSLLFYC